MPVVPDADIEITAFAWVPPFAEGLVRALGDQLAVFKQHQPKGAAA